MNKVLQLIGLIALAIAVTFYRLFVITKVWALTAVPVGAPHIGLMQAFGISLLLGVIHHHTVDSSEKTMGQRAAVMFTHAIEISLGWGLAYLFFG